MRVWNMRPSEKFFGALFETAFSAYKGEKKKLSACFKKP